MHSSKTVKRLKVMDRSMLAVDQALRAMRCPGFETQMFVWLSGRADRDRLRTGLERLRQRFPVTAARLVEDPGEGGPAWQVPADASPVLREVNLDSAEQDAVLDFAASLLSVPSDPAQVDPIRFQLLHRPDGRDVFLAHYNHVLMDNNAAVPLLREIGRLGWFPQDVDEHPCEQKRDLVRAYLKRYSRSRRREALARTLDLWRQAVGSGAGGLGRRDRAQTGPLRIKILTRVLEPAATRAVQARALKVCGYPNLSMALVASLFRALGPLAVAEGKRRNLNAGIGVDLGLRGRDGPLFDNLMSLVPITARPEELEDRDELTRMLSRQMRARLADGLDLGMAQLASLYSRRPTYATWGTEVLLRHGFSLWYAYFGALDAAGGHFCGAPIENLFFAGPYWPSAGLTLLVNQFRGQLLFQATYAPDTVSESRAASFLDAVLADLV